MDIIRGESPLLKRSDDELIQGHPNQRIDDVKNLDKISIPEITIEITDDRMWVTGKSPTGRYTENVPIETKEKCDRIKFQVNPTMFKALISQYPKCKIGDSFILFSGENWTYTVALQIDGE